MKSFRWFTCSVLCPLILFLHSLVQGCLLDNERVMLYSKIVDKGYAVRFAFAALVFGDPSEALFWLQLPHFLYLLAAKSQDKSPQLAASSSSCVLDHRETATTNLASPSENALSQNLMKLKMVCHRRRKLVLVPLFLS